MVIKHFRGHQCEMYKVIGGSAIMCFLMDQSPETASKDSVAGVDLLNGMILSDGIA